MSLEHSPIRQKGRHARGRLDRNDWPLLLNVREVAYELGVSVRRVYQLIQAGKLAMVKIDKATRVETASMLELVRASAGGVIAELAPGMRGAPPKAPKDTAEDAKPADSSPPRPRSPMFGDRRFKEVRKPKGARKPSRRRAARAAAKPAPDVALQEA